MPKKRRNGSGRRTRKSKVYLNTSISMRAVSPWEKHYGDTIVFLWNLKRHGFKLITSSVLWMEKLRPDTRRRIKRFFNTIGVKTVHVDIKKLELMTNKFLSRERLGESRRVDVMHLFAAKHVGAKYIASIDRFHRRYAGYFRLKYINFYTGVPLGNRSGGSGGGKEGTRREKTEEDY